MTPYQRAERFLAQLLNDMVQGEKVEPFTIRAVCGNRRLAIVFHDAEKGEQTLTECQRDCIRVIRESGRRLKKDEVIDALNAAGLIHGESTISQALAHLARIGELDGARPGTRHGYGIPGDGPTK